MIQITENAEIPRVPTDNPVRVFMIDDDATFCAMVQGTLKKYGYEVATCGNPAKALEQYTRHKDAYQLVLLDYHLPGLNGAQTLTHLRRLNPKVKVVLCAGVGELQLRQLMHQLPLDGYIHKPLRTEETLATFRQVLAKPVVSV